MPVIRTHRPASRTTRDLLWRDIAVVVGVTTLGFLLAAHFNVGEVLYAVTRGGERFQIDELPVGMLVLLAALMWLSWRRYRQARIELRAREVVEARLARALADNRELAQENLRVQEVERKHLARELHDELGQYLNAIKLDATSICEAAGGDGTSSISASLAIIRTVDRVHSVVSDMIARLRPVGLDELGLVAAIECCVDHWRQRQPDTRFELSVRGDFDGFGEEANLTVYRVIQEGLTNAHKHANAHRVEIVAERLKAGPHGGDELRLTIADDGRGMDPHSRSSRFGLTGMRERVEMMGGAFAVESAPGRGLRLTARLPLGKDN